MSHKKYVREQRIQKDKKQALFILTDNKICATKSKPEIPPALMVQEPVMCPFCLHIDKIGNFLISTKKGYHKGQGKCPECQNRMELQTLTAKWTPEQFADWVYPYSRSGFWQKCKFKTFNDRLYKIGWSYRFWRRYRELKGEDTTESYEEHLKRIQREEYEQMQKEGKEIDVEKWVEEKQKEIESRYN